MELSSDCVRLMNLVILASSTFNVLAMSKRTVHQLDTKPLRHCMTERQFGHRQKLNPPEQSPILKTGVDNST